MSTPESPDLPAVKAALEDVLGEYGPQQLTDGVHGHLSWLLDLVNSCLEKDKTPEVPPA